MKARFLCAIALLSLGLAGKATIAAPPRQEDCLQTAMSQSALNACAARKSAVADLRLNKAYRDVLRYLGPDETQQLVRAERAWIVFRDADCAFFSGGGGSMAPMNEGLCRAGLAEARAAELESWPPNATRDALNPVR